MGRSRRIRRLLESSAPEREECLILTEPSALRILRYDLVFTDKLKDSEIEDLILSWVTAYQALRTPFESFWEFKLSERKSYIDDLGEHLQAWFYDKFLMDFTEDLNEEEKDKIEERWFNWLDVIELVQTSDYFELLYRFIEQIADVDYEIDKVKVTRRKVIIEYGQRSSN
ncbi:hypothetical protein ITP31_004760 [Salmonella enterica]|uniref:hypothetical protein n=1 Tax=Serratia phage PCH45 TaxID=2608368 RepID=UPI0012A86A48|nr:hypothetical protein [Salmonella enterica]QFP93188.1 hypothetical protein [Serratia phage PCH45]